jgi:hypothetical protein
MEFSFSFNNDRVLSLVVGLVLNAALLLSRISRYSANLLSELFSPAPTTSPFTIHQNARRLAKDEFLEEVDAADVDFGWRSLFPFSFEQLLPSDQPISFWVIAVSPTKEEDDESS